MCFVPCARDCQMSAWSAWTDCTTRTRCGNGVQKRSRYIIEANLDGGRECPDTLVDGEVEPTYAMHFLYIQWRRSEKSERSDVMCDRMRWRRRSFRNKNKKSELMLMRRARAYGSSCSQVILVYLYPFRRSSLFCSQKLQKKLPKINFKAQGRSMSSMLTFLKSSLLVLVKIISMTVPICNNFYVRRANSGRIKSFKRDAPLFRPLVRGDPFYAIA